MQCAEPEEALALAPAEGAARNGAKRKRLGGGVTPAGAHSANGILGATSGDASRHMRPHCVLPGSECQAALVTHKRLGRTCPCALSFKVPPSLEGIGSAALLQQEQ